MSFPIVGTVGPNDLIYVLGTMLAAALSGGYVTWKRLKVLGTAERGKLEAEKEDILSQAEDRATARSLEAMRAALEASDREREYLLNQLATTRDELTDARRQIADLNSRLSQVEAVTERIQPGGKRKTDPPKEGN